MAKDPRGSNSAAPFPFVLIPMPNGSLGSMSLLLPELLPPLFVPLELLELLPLELLLELPLLLLPPELVPEIGKPALLQSETKPEFKMNELISFLIMVSS